MKRREALGLLSASLLASLGGGAMAKPGGNGGGHGHGGHGHGGGHDSHPVVNGVVTGFTTDPATSAVTGFVVHAHGHGPAGYDVNVAVTSTTVYKLGDGQPAQASDVVVGSVVQVKGSFNSAHTVLTAVQVFVKPAEDDGGDGGHEAEVEGSVVSVNTTGFVVHPKAHHGVQPPDVNVAVTGTTVFRNETGGAADMSAITVGTNVSVKGSLDATTSTLTASTVVIEGADD